MTVTSTKMMSLGVGEVVVLDDLLDLLAVLAAVPGVGLVGDEADAAACAVAQEPFGHVASKSHLGDAQLEGAEQPGQRATTATMAAMKKAAIFTPSGRSTMLSTVV